MTYVEWCQTCENNDYPVCIMCDYSEEDGIEPTYYYKEN